jgi:light-regulated signal transduction histidine kinase (bacteriophytochrome)
VVEYSFARQEQLDFEARLLPFLEGQVIVIVRDITERKMAERNLILQTERLARSNAELKRFAYVASHDLQEPLRAVSGYTQLLARRYLGRLDESADQFISYATEAARRMTQLIDDLLTYSRIDSETRKFEQVDTESIVDRAIYNLHEAIQSSGAIITRDPLPPVHGVDFLLLQMFQNLLSNSIKFRKDEPPRIHISCRESGGEHVFFMKDNGIGIDPQYAGRIMIAFQRLHTRSEYPGTGIGLAICRKVAEEHGGRLWVESKAGEGATFYFTIAKGGLRT